MFIRAKRSKERNSIFKFKIKSHWLSRYCLNCIFAASNAVDYFNATSHGLSQFLLSAAARSKEIGNKYYLLGNKERKQTGRKIEFNQKYV